MSYQVFLEKSSGGSKLVDGCDVFKLGLDIYPFIHTLSDCLC